MLHDNHDDGTKVDLLGRRQPRQEAGITSGIMAMPAIARCVVCQAEMPNTSDLVHLCGPECVAEYASFQQDMEEMAHEKHEARTCGGPLECRECEAYEKHLAEMADKAAENGEDDDVCW